MGPKLQLKRKKERKRIKPNKCRAQGEKMLAIKDEQVESISRK